jgi:hypothetical protein
MVDRRRSVNVCSTPLTDATITMIHILPKSLPILVIGIITHPNRPKELVIRLGTLSVFDRRDPAVVTGFDDPERHFVIVIVVCHDHSIILGMMVDVPNSDVLTHRYVSLDGSYAVRRNSVLEPHSGQPPTPQRQHHIPPPRGGFQSCRIKKVIHPLPKNSHYSPTQ